MGGEGLRLAFTLQPFWISRARVQEGVAWFSATVTDEPGPDVARQNVASGSKKASNSGMVQNSSTWLTNDPAKTRSTGPSPKT
jgi:hypothetical protein